MEDNEQINAFEAEIEKAIQHFRHEFSVPYASLIGVLHLKAHELCKEAFEIGEEED